MPRGRLGMEWIMQGAVFTGARALWCSGADASEPQDRERTMRTEGDSRTSDRTRTEEMLNPTVVGAHRGGVPQGAPVHDPHAWGSQVPEGLLAGLAADRRVA